MGGCLGRWGIFAGGEDPCVKLFAMMALAIFGPLVVFGGGIAIFMEQARIRATLRLIRWLFYFL